jgi:hypothetical protein
VPPKPSNNDGGQIGFFFYNGQGGPWLYQSVTGDFAFEVFAKLSRH